MQIQLKKVITYYQTVTADSEAEAIELVENLGILGDDVHEAESDWEVVDD